MPKMQWVVVLVCAIGLSSPCAAASETLTIVADKWCPYNCGQDDVKHGYMVDIVRSALKKSGIDVVYKVLPWAEAIEKTRAGQYDAVVGASRGDASDFIFPEVLQGISINQFWVKKGSAWQYNGLSSLSGLRLGVVAGYSYGKLMDTYIKERREKADENIQVVGDVSATEFNIQKLLNGNVDAILEDKNVVEYYFASQNMPLSLESVGNPVDEENVADTFIYIAFGPNNPKAAEYADMLTRGVKQMRKNGELQAILASYNVDDAYHFSVRRVRQP